MNTIHHISTIYRNKFFRTRYNSFVFFLLFNLAFGISISNGEPLNIDGISELTLSAGVTIEDVLIKDGQVGISTTNPGSDLDIKGSFRLWVQWRG